MLTPELQLRYGPPCFCPKCEQRTAYLRRTPAGFQFMRCDRGPCGYAYDVPEEQPAR